MNKASKTFETFDIDLAAYLMLEGLKFIEAVPEEILTNSDKPKIKMRFFDEKEVARDLEKVFMGSPVKRFNDFRKYLLREVHRTLRGI